MAKSKFPEQLDTSVEIPAVRDNIIEIGSDVINSIRSAIFQIERTLGINPQGAVGNTVSGRLNKALDGNGNISKEALDRAGLLSGPIVDSDVSKVAAINESKLRLEYPTTLLQDQISILDNQVDSLLQTIEELALLLGAHVHPAALNRHMGQAITIDSIDSTTSSDGIISLETVTAQQAFESIFKSHINYDGTDISLSNRSHEADQVFYDNVETSAYIDSPDVQGAIDELLGIATEQLDVHQNNQHDNSILKTSTLKSASNNDEGMLVLDLQDVFYSESSTASGSGRSNVTFLSPPDTPALPIDRCDILKIFTEDEEYMLQISDVNYSVDGLTVDSVEVYGRFTSNSPSEAQAKIYKNQHREANIAGLLLCAREYQSLGGASRSNADIVQIANPNSATIVSKGIRPEEISLTNRYIKLSVDSGSEIEIDLYDGDLATAGRSQTLDSIILAINSQVSENRLSVSAYRVDYEEHGQSELALVHTMPSSSDISRTLKVSRGTDDGIVSSGLALYEDMYIDFGIGTRYYIQGHAYTDLDAKMAETGLDLIGGTSGVTSSTVDFESLGIVTGDILVITNSVSDDGTYVILDVSSSGITVDQSQLPSNVWAGETTDETEFYVYKNSFSLNSYAFRVEPSGSSTASVIDVFLDYNRNVIYEERLTYGSVSDAGSDSLIAICDFDGDVSTYTESDPGQLEASLPDPAGNVFLSLDSGPIVELNNISSEYITLHSGRYNLSVRVFVKDSSAIASKIITSSSSFSIDLYGYNNLNKEENLFLGRLLYESAVSRVAGAGDDYPRIFSKIRRGSIGYKDLGTDVIQAAIQRPMAETRSNGVIRGLEIAEAIDDGTYVVTISAGVCYVKGKRFELEKIDSYITDIEVSGIDGVDKLYVAINEWGQISFKAADSATCDCPFDVSNYCILGSVENDGVTIDPIDLRLFINDLDLTVLNSITVSPQYGMGHFTSINKAIKYAKRFSEVFPKAGVPTVHLKSGIHRVVVDIPTDTISADESAVINAQYDQGIWINFPINITGEGDSTVLDLYSSWTDAEVDGDTVKSNSAYGANHGFIFIAGSRNTSAYGQVQPGGDHDVLSEGTVRISNLKFSYCRVNFSHPYIYENEDGSENEIDELQFKLVIDNVTFDYGDYGDSVLPGVFLGGETDPVSETASGVGHARGGVDVHNCTFINSCIYLGIDTESPDEFHNIKICNNTRSGMDTAGPDAHLIKNGSGTSSFFSPDDCPAENMVNIYGNTLSGWDSIAPEDRHIDDGGTLWGDRFSNNVYLPAKLGVGTNDIDDAVDIHVGRDAPNPGRVYIRTDEAILGAGSAGDSDTGGLIIGDKDAFHLVLGRQASSSIFGISTRASTGYFSGRLYIQNGNSATPGGNTEINNHGGDVRMLKHGKAYDGNAMVKIGGSVGLATASDYIFSVNGNSYISGNLAVSGAIDLSGAIEGPLLIETEYGESVYGLRIARSGNSSSMMIKLENADANHVGLHVQDNGAFTVGPAWDDKRFSVYEDGTAAVEKRLVIGSDDGDAGSNEELYIYGNKIMLDAPGTGNASVEINAGSGNIPSLRLAENGSDRWTMRTSTNGASGLLQFRDRNDEVVLQLGSANVSTAGGLLVGPTTIGINNDSGGKNYSRGLHIKQREPNGGTGLYRGIMIEKSSADLTWSIYYKESSNPGDSTDTGDLLFAKNSSADTLTFSIYGYIADSGGASLMNFTGQHRSSADKSVMISENIGKIVIATGAYNNLDSEGNMPTIMESLPSVQLSRSEGDKRVFGVIAEFEKEDDEYRHYNGAGAFVSTYRKDSGDERVLVNSIGEGAIWICNINGDLENGDYITTCEIPGYGMRQNDDLLHNYTVAKITQDCDFDLDSNNYDCVEFEFDGQTYKKAFVGCTYHCG